MIYCQDSPLRLTAGGFDNAGIVEQLYQEACETTRVLDIPPGDYHSSQPIVFDSTVDKEGKFRPCYINAQGAVFDNTIVFGDWSLVTQGLEVRNAPSHGFVFLRGQGGYHERLYAEGNAGHGFFFGSDGFGANSQVAFTQLDTPISQCNDLDGFHIDGNATANRNWFNQNLLNNAKAIDNLGRALGSTLGTAAVSTSRVNYNAFVNFGSERNGDIIEFENMFQRGNTFVNLHAAEMDAAGNSMLMNASANYIFGGRTEGDIVGKQINTIFMNTGTPGEGIRFSYDPASDLD